MLSRESGPLGIAPLHWYARLHETIILALAFSVLSLLPSRADDGSWSADFTEAAGPVYATTENQDISLESELLRFRIVKQGVTEAVFLFRNASAREVHVEAGFPVLISG